MAVKKRLKQLIEQGCVIGVLHPDGPMTEVVLAGALWWDKPLRLRWCGVWPEHQGHIHELRYTKATTANDGRDVVFYLGGVMVAVVVPIVESGLDLNAALELFAGWRAYQAGPGQVKEFLEFLAVA